MAKPIIIKVPAQTVRQYADMYSGQSICEGKLRGLVDVRGSRYAVTGCLYSRYWDDAVSNSGFDPLPGPATPWNGQRR